jgi:hypothetical protein
MDCDLYHSTTIAHIQVKHTIHKSIKKKIGGRAGEYPE